MSFREPELFSSPKNLVCRHCGELEDSFSSDRFFDEKSKIARREFRKGVQSCALPVVNSSGYVCSRCRLVDELIRSDRDLTKKRVPKDKIPIARQLREEYQQRYRATQQQGVSPMVVDTPLLAPSSPSISLNDGVILSSSSSTLLSPLPPLHSPPPPPPPPPAPAPTTATASSSSSTSPPQAPSTSTCKAQTNFSAFEPLPRPVGRPRKFESGLHFRPDEADERPSPAKRSRSAGLFFCALILIFLFCCCCCYFYRFIWFKLFVGVSVILRFPRLFDHGEGGRSTHSSCR